MTEEQITMYREIGKRVKLLRGAQQMSQRDLAKVVGVSDATICWIENGKQPSALHVFVALSKALRVKLDDLIGD